MSTPEVVDGTVEDVTPEVQASGAEPRQLPARRERRSEVIRALPVEQLAESFSEYQELLPKLLTESDWQDAGRDGKFVKKSGWRKIATAFDLDVVLVEEVVERDVDGSILRAKTVMRAIAPSGRTMDGDGYCTRDEFTGRRAGNPKLENDLRGTAATRAKNRAISDLVAMGAVSAEEVSLGGGGQSLPEWATPGNPAEIKQAIGRAMSAAGVSADAFQAACQHVLDTSVAAGGGQVPRIVGNVLDAVARAVTQAAAAGAPQQAPQSQEQAA